MFVFDNIYKGNMEVDTVNNEKIEKIKKEIKDIEETEDELKKRNKELKKTKNEEKIKYYKMLMIFNAIEDGWTVKKCNGIYKFHKRNEDRDEMLQESHIDTFLRESLDYLSNLFTS
jgi:hypothetical protein